MTPSGVPLFTFEHVSVAGDGDAWRLRDAHGMVPDVGITAIVGPSGSGKSTLLRCCNRLERPSAGTVRFRGVDVGAIDPLVLRRRVGMVFQRPTPFPGSVRDNLRVAAPALGDTDARVLLGRVHLDTGFLDRDATALSGGEAQRLCLARALAASPEVLLMDEVTSSLDAAGRVALEELARDLAASGVPLLWVTHDSAQVRRVADHVLVVLEGRIAHAAPLADLVESAPGGVRAFLEEARGAE